MKQYRRALGWSRKYAAWRLGVAVSTWSQWENGKRLPTADFLGMIAHLYEVPICHLFCPAKPACPAQCTLMREVVPGRALKNVRAMAK